MHVLSRRLRTIYGYTLCGNEKARTRFPFSRRRITHECLIGYTRITLTFTDDLDLRLHLNILKMHSVGQEIGLFYRATTQHTVLLSQFCPSVRRVYCDKTKQRTADILVQHETAITLVFRHQQWLVGDAPFPVKYSPKVTHRFE